MYHIEILKRKNSKHYTPILDLAEIKDVQEYLKSHNLIVNPETPYIFTHIKLSDNSILTETFNLGGRELPCSPTKLKEVLLP